MTTSSIEFRHQTTTSEQIGKVQLSFLAVFAANGPQLHKTYARWRDYFEHIMALPGLIEASKIPGYQQLTTGPQSASLQESLNAFLVSPRDRLFVISGDAGCGKTSFIERLAYDMADEGLVSIEAMMDREEFGSPRGWIPLYYSLRGTGLGFRTEIDLRRALLSRCNHMGQFWNELPMHPEWLFERNDLSWILILDGLDEIWGEEGQRGFIDSLRMLLDSFPLVKVILTTRPGAVLPDLTMGVTRVGEVAALSESEIRSYITTVTDSETAILALNTLQSHADLWKLCSRPSYLAAAMRELGGTDEPPPRDKVTALDTTKMEMGIDEPNEDVHTEVVSPPGQFQSVAVNDLVLVETLTKDKEESPLEEDREFVLASRTGQVVDQIYRYLWERERLRRGIHKHRTDEWKEQAGDLALATDGKHLRFRRQIIRQFLSDYEAEFWLLSLGVLNQPPESDILFCFFTELTKAYFAAVVLSSHLAAGESELFQERFAMCQDDFRAQLRSILLDISNEDISSILNF